MDTITPQLALLMRGYAKCILKKEMEVGDALTATVIRGYTREGAVEGLRHWGIKIL